MKLLELKNLFINKKKMEIDYNEFNLIEFKKKYIISKNNNKQSFDILSSLKEIKSHKFELVDENFLRSKNIDESIYANKYVFNFEINGKNYIQFLNDCILLEKKANVNFTTDNKV